VLNYSHLAKYILKVGRSVHTRGDLNVRKESSITS
jgi:hypothetical protein